MRVVLFLFLVVCSFGAHSETEGGKEEIPVADTVKADKKAVVSDKQRVAEAFGTIFKSEGTSLFCGCKYKDWKLLEGEDNGCWYYNSKPEITTVSWFQVMDVRVIAKDRKCWKKGGLKNCIKNDTAVRYFLSDPLTYLPAEPNIRRISSNYRGFSEGWPGEDKFGLFCNSKVNPTEKKIIPRTGARGDIARTLFYIRDRYKVSVGMNENTLVQWMKHDPVSEEECWRNEQAVKMLGFSNPHMHCQK